MGIMSKGSRLSERPKPPTFHEMEEDLLHAKDTDKALAVGENHLQNINLAASCFQSQDSNCPAGANSSTSSTGAADISQSQIKESYGKVLRMLELYSTLKEAPTQLEENISKLKVVGADMSESIEHLKSLSLTIKGNGQADSVVQNRSLEPKKSSGSKDKAKAKKKK